jgi:hypothetical protein
MLTLFEQLRNGRGLIPPASPNTSGLDYAAHNAALQTGSEHGGSVIDDQPYVGGPIQLPTYRQPDRSNWTEADFEDEANIRGGGSSRFYDDGG